MEFCSPERFYGQPDLNWYGWADINVEFTGFGGVAQSTDTQRTLFINYINTTIQVYMELPPYAAESVAYSEDTTEHDMLNHAVVPVVPRGNIPIEMNVRFENLAVGRHEHAIDYQVQAIHSANGTVICQLPNATLHYILNVLKPDENHLGGLLSMGWIALALIWTSCMVCAVWMHRKRRVRSVQVMQPVFLAIILAGVFVLGTAIASVSLTDENVQWRMANAACVATPWFIVTGFTLIFSALFSKLWRINQVFQGAQHCRRVSVQERHVLWPLLVWLGLNWVILVLRTVLDPPEFSRVAIDNDPADTIATCQSDSWTQRLLYLANIGVTLSAFGAAAYQAYRARNIGDEYAESKSLLMAIFIWTEILIIGVPVVLLVGLDSSTTSYFVVVSMVFGLCISMLGAIFVPLYMQVQRTSHNGSTGVTVRVTGIQDGNTISTPNQSENHNAHETVAPPPSHDEDKIILDKTSDRSSDCVALLQQQVSCLEGQVAQLRRRNEELEGLISRKKEGVDSGGEQGDDSVA